MIRTRDYLWLLFLLGLTLAIFVGVLSLFVFPGEPRTLYHFGP